ncbi:ribosomal protein L36 (apicoplast) [Theileria orientalis]|uniref:Ribosomal protein n=1 Tax=Theileria orientalis TaxID=68886 RepID=A0A976SK09_THEOR|nr:ribosomal protein L36 [Theileria orientalis]
MKIKTSIKKICKNCIIVKREKKLINTCKFSNHKQRQK